MRTTSDDTDSAGTADGPSPAPERTRSKQWGPFTGRQLTTIAVAALVVVAMPTGAWAAAKLQHVVVSGPSGKSAVVDKNGRLQVGGHVAASVSGSVKAAAAAPNDLIEQTTYFVGNDDGCSAVFSPPAHKAAVVTNVAVNVLTNAAPGTTNHIAVYTDNECTVQITGTNPTGLGNVALPLGAGFAVPAKHSLYVFSQTSGTESDIYVYGYEVPASSVSTTASRAQGSGGKQPR